ncbi:hypothetical protein GCM10009038_03490 [Salinicola rhizosphaerae]|uniref:Uncharacterized protein n=1 Tax=Salinicola rhizosphaerae TaxID=1443141 RepID=A0ABQ3DSB7_9GAMM|nr:hypothetical protein GCM10009038_03490 [Salinicola rhizosphaerae]
MLVQQIHVAGLDRMNLAIGNGFHFTFTFVAEYRFDVILVVNVGFRTRMNTRDIEGKTAVVFGQHQTGAIPVTVLGLDETLGFHALLKIAYDHRIQLLIIDYSG